MEEFKIAGMLETTCRENDLEQWAVKLKSNSFVIFVGLYINQSLH